jgi:hypothetical protein
MEVCEGSNGQGRTSRKIRGTSERILDLCSYP